MSDEAMGDEVYQPDTQDEQDAGRGPDPENELDAPDPEDLLDAGYSPPEQPYAVDERITAAGQRERETLDERLAEERPDNRPTDTGADDGAAPGPAEEAAVRVRDDTPRGW
ncbi:hypothetical protein [Streptomyces sp. NRRL S-1448]|uniref:hypothetical protein n=1 Tax=Streptomyces sp. NRRL S-1448 TaxID=1463883 RepID=UPI0004BF7EF3|nr:hypothetical protein [Streptomyces sp. NRRL S-1448]